VNCWKLARDLLRSVGASFPAKFSRPTCFSVWLHGWAQHVVGTANELARGNSGPSNSFVLVHVQVSLRKGPFRPELSHCRSGCSRIWAQHVKLVKHCNHVSAGLYMLSNMVTTIWLVQIHFVLLPAGCRGVVNVINSSSTTRDGVSHAFGDLHLRACVGTTWAHWAQVTNVGHKMGPLGTSNKCWAQHGPIGH